MDAKTRAKFINSISDVPNTSEDDITGKKLNDEIRTVHQNSDNSQSANTRFPEPLEPEENEQIFAQGLPEWDLEPPKVAVRRVRKK